MNAQLFNDMAEFVQWRAEQFPDSPEMRRELLSVSAAEVNGWPALLVYQWLNETKFGTHGFKLIFRWVTLSDFNESSEYKTVIVERQGSQRRETILLPPKLKASKEPEKITVIRAFTLE
jgi:hypothetical protein